MRHHASCQFHQTPARNRVDHLYARPECVSARFSFTCIASAGVYRCPPDRFDAYPQSWDEVYRTDNVRCRTVPPVLPLSGVVLLFAPRALLLLFFLSCFGRFSLLFFFGRVEIHRQSILSSTLISISGTLVLVTSALLLCAFSQILLSVLLLPPVCSASLVSFRRFFFLKERSSSFFWVRQVCPCQADRSARLFDCFTSITASLVYQNTVYIGSSSFEVGLGPLH